MRTLRRLLVGPLVFLTALAAPAFGQDQHAVDPAALATAVSQYVAKQDADRAAIRETLNRPAVRDFAEKAGIDLARLTSVVDTMSGADLEQASTAAHQVDQALVGGASTIVVSTTTVILVLLVLLLLVIAVK